MKKTFIIGFALFLSAMNFVAKASNLWQQADSAYNARDYEQAIELYQKAIEIEGTSSQLLYNLGNAYYRANKLGKALINYERALRLNPTNEEARQNIEFVNTRIIDRKAPDSKDGKGLSTFEKYLGDSSDYNNSLIQLAQPNTFAWITIGLFALTLCGVAVYFLGNTVLIRKLAFFSSFILLLATICGIVATIKSANNASRKDMAIIMAESTQLSTSPSRPLNASEQVVLLHEGTKIQVIDSVATPNNPDVKKWYEVKLDGATSAWIEENDIEFI